MVTTVELLQLSLEPFDRLESQHMKPDLLHNLRTQRAALAADRAATYASWAAGDIATQEMLDASGLGLFREVERLEQTFKIEKPYQAWPTRLRRFPLLAMLGEYRVQWGKAIEKVEGSDASWAIRSWAASNWGPLSRRGSALITVTPTVLLESKETEGIVLQLLVD